MTERRRKSKDESKYLKAQFSIKNYTITNASQLR